MSHQLSCSSCESPSSHWQYELGSAPPGALRDKRAVVRSACRLLKRGQSGGAQHTCAARGTWTRSDSSDARPNRPPNQALGRGQMASRGCPLRRVTNRSKGQERRNARCCASPQTDGICWGPLGVISGDAGTTSGGCYGTNCPSVGPSLGKARGSLACHAAQGVSRSRTKRGLCPRGDGHAIR